MSSSVASSFWRGITIATEKWVVEEQIWLLSLSPACIFFVSSLTFSRILLLIMPLFLIVEWLYTRWPFFSSSCFKNTKWAKNAQKTYSVSHSWAIWREIASSCLALSEIGLLNAENGRKRCINSKQKVLIDEKMYHANNLSIWVSRMSIVNYLLRFKWNLFID